MAAQKLGIIGGTGIGDTFAARGGVEQIELDTPFGPTSGAILRAEVDGLECLFLNRHGQGHTLTPSRVPYRANIYALKSLGVTQVLATGATGSLREKIAPGDLVVCDQLIDKTYGRDSTFFDDGLAVHLEFADPFCPRLREQLIAAGRSIETRLHDGGTYVCMEGPQFSTRAESRMHRAWGADLIGMTCLPEAKLAREAELCYALVALPTDYDSWRPRPPGADPESLLTEILANMRRAAEAAAALIEQAIRRLAAAGPVSCTCHDALAQAVWTDKSRVPAHVIDKLRPLVGRYFVGPV